MKFSSNKYLLAAALAGLAGGTAARAAQSIPAVPASGGSAWETEYQNKKGQPDQKKEIEKHACKGLNSCKGQGGGDESQWGKNDCKGKGACATDGSKPKKKM